MANTINGTRARWTGKSQKVYAWIKSSGSWLIDFLHFGRRITMEFFFAPPWERKSHDLFISQGKSPACVAYQINWKLLKSLLKLQSIFHSPQKPNHIRYYYSINRKFQNYTLFTQRPIRVTCPIKQIAGIHWDIYIKRSLGKHHDKHAACFFQRFPSSPKIESSCHVAHGYIAAAPKMKIENF